MCMHWAFVMCRPLDRYQHGGSSYASRLKRAAVGPISFHSKHATQIRLFPGSFQYLLFSLPPGAGKDEPIPG